MQKSRVNKKELEIFQKQDQKSFSELSHNKTILLTIQIWNLLYSLTSANNIFINSLFLCSCLLHILHGRFEKKVFFSQYFLTEFLSVWCLIIRENQINKKSSDISSRGHTRCHWTSKQNKQDRDFFTNILNRKEITFEQLNSKGIKIVWTVTEF